MHITRREKKFWEQHLSCVRHITLDPKGPGVVRLHMIPPRAEGKDEPFLLLLNGAKLIPLNLRGHSAGQLHGGLGALLHGGGQRPGP